MMEWQQKRQEGVQVVRQALSKLEEIGLPDALVQRERLGSDGDFSAARDAFVRLQAVVERLASTELDRQTPPVISKPLTNRPRPLARLMV